MSRRKTKILENISFIDAGAKGIAVGRAEDGRAVMVKNAIPGDVADVHVKKKRKNYYQGVAVKFSQYSEDRVTPKCEYFGLCGGCKWQNMSYDKQLFYKEKEVIQNIKRIAHIESFESAPILASKSIYHYRNKMEFSFSNQRWITEDEIQSGKEITQRNALGFHLPGMWSKILDLENCYLQEDPSNALKNFVRQWTLAHHIPYFDVREHQGVMRSLMLRSNSKGEFMLVFQLYKDFEQKNELFDAIINTFPAVVSLSFAINSKRNDSLYDLDIQTYWGEGYIWEQMEDLKFKISPKSFFQTNYSQALELYRITREYAAIKPHDIVYDLYTGTGTIAQFVAREAQKVVGIESVPQAIADAKENARTNGIDNCTFFCGDMKEVFTPEFINQNGSPNVVITDPPREGMHAKVIEQILNLQAERIVYVSCNSATQARDLELLKSQYQLLKIQPVDMFPQTHHVENIALLEKR